jgi:ribosomal protein L34E
MWLRQILKSKEYKKEYAHQWYLKNKERHYFQGKYLSILHRESYNVRNRRNVLMRTCGLSKEEAEKILAYTGPCEICGEQEVEIDHRYNTLKKLAFDHNHITKKYRGRICGRCNKAIGGLRVDEEGIDLLLAAISYIKNNEQ